jgi:predicted TIM-barrel fold metal-dependent hydrolase
MLGRLALCAIVVLLLGACEDAEPPSNAAGAQGAATETPVAPTAIPPPTATPSPTPQPTPIVIANLPIVDLHFHPDAAWGPALPELFDRIGVRAAGNGASGPDSVALAEAERHGGRVIPFTGGYELRQLIARYGEAAWQLTHPEALRAVDAIEAGLRQGVSRGIGELHVNNWMSNLPNAPQYRYPADSPLLQRLMALSAAYDVPVSVHMDAEPASVAQMESLLASNRQGIFLWAHTGHYAPPELVRRLLGEHPNLYCELSYRTSISGGRAATVLDDAGRLREVWRTLLEDYPERFVIGTDIGFASPSLYTQHIAFWRLILEQLSPETAAKLAFVNAERLLNRDR